MRRNLFEIVLSVIQFVLGDDLQSCRDALASDGDTSLHLLERINVDLQVQNSIIPSAVNLARIKVSGNLPTLQLNFSDSKYKSILRLIDVTIPKFGDETPNTIPSTVTGAYRLPRLFVGPDKEYNIEDDGDEESSRDEFLEVEDSGGQVGLCQRVRYCGPLICQQCLDIWNSSAIIRVQFPGRHPTCFDIKVASRARGEASWFCLL